MFLCRLWNELPSWIEYIAMDEGGEWTGYRFKPRILGNSWDCGNSDERPCYIPEFSYPKSIGVSWEDSLIKRGEILSLFDKANVL